MKIAIFDLDGCISNDIRRRPLLPKRGSNNYDAYHKGCGEDPVANRDSLDAHIAAGHHIVIITARPIEYEAETAIWLARHFALDEFALLMRPDGDHSPSHELKIALFEQNNLLWSDVVATYDDRADVLQAYHAAGASANYCLTIDAPTAKASGTGGVLRSMADTFDERNAVYGDNYKRVGPILKILFPDGLTPELLATDAFGLTFMVVGKLTRFAATDLTHVDSIHDLGVYAAMAENSLEEL